MVDQIEIPAVQFHFNDGGTITLDSIHLFRSISEDRACLIVQSSSSQKLVLGAVASVNFAIGFDLAVEWSQIRFGLVD